MNPIAKILKETLKTTATKVDDVVAKGPLELPAKPKAKAEPWKPAEKVADESQAPKAQEAKVGEELEPDVSSVAIDKQVRESLNPTPKTIDIEQVDLPMEKGIKKAAENIDVELEARHIVTADLDHFDANDSWQPNFDTFDTLDDVTATIASMAERNKDSITEARRGVVADEQLRALAAEMHVDGSVIKDVLERETGQTLNAETIVATRQFLNQSGERIVSLAKMVEAGKATDEDKIVFRRQIALHKEMMDNFMGARAEAGRTLRAFGIKLGSDGEQIKLMQEAMERMQGGNMDALAKQFAHLEDMAALNNTVKEVSKGKFLAVAEEVFINSILSGMKTQVVNITGNALFPIKGMVDAAVAARIGKFYKADDHVMIGEAQAQLYGYLSGAKDAWRMAAKAFRTGESADGATKLEMRYPKAISSENLEIGGSLMRIADYFNVSIPEKLPKMVDKATDVVGSAIRFPTERMLTPMDEFFKTLARRAHISREAFREANRLPDDATPEMIAETIDRMISTPPKQVLQGADDFALYNTFQTPLGETGQKFQKLVNDVPGLKFIFPFVRTPVNIFKAGIAESTPIGLFSARIRAEIAEGGVKRDMALGRMAVGTSLAGITAMHVADGTITGAGPSDFKARSLLMAQGWQPYSIRVTNPVTGGIEYHSYQRAEPMAYIIGAVADTVELAQWSEGIDDIEYEQEMEKMQGQLSSAVIAGIVENTMNKTFMTGAASFVEAMNDPQRYFSSWVDQMAGAMIPFSSLRRDLTKIQDPYVREAWETMDKLKRSSGVAGWADDLPIKKDVYGEPIVHPSGDMLGIFSPFPTSKQNVSEMKQEVARVMKATRTVPLTKPSKFVNGVKLDVHQYDKLVTLSRTEIEFNGMNFSESLEDLMQSDIYIESTDDYKSEMIRSVQQSYDNKAKAMLKLEDDELMDNIHASKKYKATKRMGKERADALFGGN